MALSLCTQEVLWVCVLLKDLGHEQVGATWVWEDNQGAIGLASNAGLMPEPSPFKSVTTSSVSMWPTT